VEDAGIQIVEQEADREAACPVCGEGVGAAPTRCRICDAPHHFDCWEYNEGCGVYGCNAQPKPRAKAADAGTVDLPAKLGLPHKRTGSYAGVWWVPPGAGAAAVGFELVGILAFAAGNSLAGAGWMAAMVGCLVWIALSSVHFYVDFEKMRISKAKAFLGRDLIEWGVLDLANVERLEVRGTATLLPGQTLPTRVYRVLAVQKTRWGRQAELEICPPMQEGDETLSEVADLFRRIHASHAFTVRMPEEVRELAPPVTNTLLLEE
jgi:hypothetical protein